MKHIQLLNDDVSYLETFTALPCCNACNSEGGGGGGGGCSCDTYVCAGYVCACDTDGCTSCNVDGCNGCIINYG